MQAAKALARGESLWDALAYEDTTIARISALQNSNNGYETAASTANLAFDMFNTTNNFMRGVSASNLSGELMARYRLGDSNGLNPVLSLTYSRRRTDQRAEYLGDGGVDRRNIYLETPVGIRLENGVDVHGYGNITIRTPRLEIRGVGLNSSERHITRSVTVDTTMRGDSVNLGIGFNQSNQSATDFANASLRADQHLDLGELGVLDVIGGEIHAGTLAANIQRVSLRAGQNSASGGSFGFSASTSGQVSFHHSQHESQSAAPGTGIYVKTGINHEGTTTVHIDELYLENARVITEGENRLEAGRVIVNDTPDYEKRSGFGIGGNIQESRRLLSPVEAGNQTNASAIATMPVTIERRNFAAIQRSTIFGATGTEPRIEALTGSLNVSNADGYEVKKDSRINLTFDVPLTSARDLRDAANNIRNGARTIAQKFTPSQTPDINLSPKQAQEIIELLQDEKIASVLEQAAAEQTQNHEVSKQTQTILQDHLSQTLLKLTQQGVGVAWGRLVDVMGTSDKGVRLFMQGKGVVIAYAFSAGLSDKTGVDRLLDAGASTANGVMVGFVMGKMLGGGANAASWVLLGAEILDDLTYNAQELERRWERSYNSMLAARNSTGWERLGNLELARAERDTAVSQATVHMVAEVSRALGRVLQSCWEIVVESPPILIGPMLPLRSVSMFNQRRNASQTASTAAPQYQP